MTGRYAFPLLCLLALSACVVVDADVPPEELTESSPPEASPPVPATEASHPPRGGCHPSYEPCVPVDSDVDCAGGGGNGPSYATGPLRVIGRDEYGLDDDGDGIGCDG